MKYLVTMEDIGGLPASLQQVVQYLEQRVIPDHEALIKLETEKKILAGGHPTGVRKTVFIVEVASNEELDQLLLSLPLWSTEKVKVTPLESFESRTAIARQMLERLKAASE